MRVVRLAGAPIVPVDTITTTINTVADTHHATEPCAFAEGVTPSRFLVVGTTLLPPVVPIEIDHRVVVAPDLAPHAAECVRHELARRVGHEIPCLAGRCLVWIGAEVAEQVGERIKRHRSISMDDGSGWRQFGRPDKVERNRLVVSPCRYGNLA